MKNTLQKSKFRILIYKGSEGYVSICYETGFVDVNDTIQEAQKHMNDGIIALLKTIKSGELTVKAINQKPQLKYRILFYLLPVLSVFPSSLDVSFFTEPFNPSNLVNSAL